MSGRNAMVKIFSDFCSVFQGRYRHWKFSFCHVLVLIMFVCLRSADPGFEATAQQTSAAVALRGMYLPFY